MRLILRSLALLAMVALFSASIKNLPSISAKLLGFSWLYSQNHREGKHDHSPLPLSAAMIGLAHADPLATQVTPALTVTSSRARLAPWTTVIEATGAIAPWQDVVLSTRIGEVRLVEIKANVGDFVKKGQILARLDDALLRAEEAELRADLDQAHAAMMQADENHQRALRLKDSGSVSVQDILQYVTQADTTKAQWSAAKARLSAKRLQLSYTEVSSPDDGVVTSRSAILGAVLPVGQELFRLIRQNRLEWRGEVTSQQLEQIRATQKVQLILPDGSVAPAVVRQVAPVLDSQSRLGIVYADVVSPSRVRSGMYLRGRIQLSQQLALVVPSSSVIFRDGRNYVLKLQSDGNIAQVKLQAVAIGHREGEDIDITQGLREGDRIVRDNGAFLSGGDTVHVVNTGAAATATAKE